MNPPRILLALSLPAALLLGPVPTAPAEDLVVVLRALDSDGEALAPDALELEATERDALQITVWRPTVEALEHGRVRIALGEPAPAAERCLVLTLARRGPAGPGARVDLAGLGAGVHELGDVPLAPPPLVCAGRVLDAARAPVAGARVQLERRWLGPSAGPPTWNPVLGADARTDREGRFALRAWTGTDELRVTARARGRAPVALAVRAGEAQAELRLAPTAAIAGRVLVDAACGHGALAVELLRDGVPLRAVPPAADGTFALDDLPAGRYAVRLRAQHDVEPLLEVGPLEVRPGETLRDPRLERLDLRARVRCLRVRVVAPDGAELPHFVAEVGPAGSAERRPFWASGDLALATAAPALDVRFTVPGYRSVHLDGLAADETVELRPGIPLRVALAGGAPDLPTGFALRVRLQPGGAEGCPGLPVPASLDARGEALWRAADPGEHALVLLVRVEATGEDYPLPPGVATPARVTVVERGAEQRVPVQLDRTALERFVEGLAR